MSKWPLHASIILNAAVGVKKGSGTSDILYGFAVVYIFLCAPHSLCLCSHECVCFIDYCISMLLVFHWLHGYIFIFNWACCWAKEVTRVCFSLRCNGTLPNPALKCTLFELAPSPSISKSEVGMLLCVLLGKTSFSCANVSQSAHSNHGSGSSRDAGLETQFE